MATSDLERMFDDWALAWSSGSTNDPELVLALFTNAALFLRTLPSSESFAKRTIAASWRAALQQSLTSNMD